MFAPFCPTCGDRVLLGTRRIVAFASAEGRHRIALRCFCGTVLDWDHGEGETGPRESSWTPVHRPANKVTSHGLHTDGQTYAVDLVHDLPDGQGPARAGSP